MTTKKNLTEEKLRKQKAADLVTFKVTGALVLLFLCVVVIKKLGGFYETLAGFDALYPLTLWFIVGGLVLAGICAALLLSVSNSTVRFLTPWGIGFGFIAALTAFFMRKTFTDDFTLLTLICGALLVLYIIFQLYHWELFLFSTATFTAGLAFYQFSRGVSFHADSIIVLLIVLAVQALCFAVAYTAAKHKGRLKFKKLRVQILSPKANPMPVYIVAAFWVVCAIAVLFLGALFAYYCMFAAIIIEFIAAVYYTVQLK